MTPTEILKQQIEVAKADVKELQLQEILLRREHQNQLAKLQQQKQLTEERIAVWTEAIEPKTEDD